MERMDEKKSFSLQSTATVKMHNILLGCHHSSVDSSVPTILGLSPKHTIMLS